MYEVSEKLVEKKVILETTTNSHVIRKPSNVKRA